MSLHLVDTGAVPRREGTDAASADPVTTFRALPGGIRALVLGLSLCEGGFDHDLARCMSGFVGTRWAEQELLAIFEQLQAAGLIEARSASGRYRLESDMARFACRRMRLDAELERDARRGHAAHFVPRVEQGSVVDLDDLNVLADSVSGGWLDEATSERLCRAIVDGCGEWSSSLPHDSVLTLVGAAVRWLQREQSDSRMVGRGYAALAQVYEDMAVDEEESPDVSMCRPKAQRRLTLPRDARWFQIGEDEPMSLDRHGPMKRILVHLVERQIDSPGQASSAADLIAAGWPGERITRSGKLRLYTTVRRLRRRGMDGVLHTREDGYLLDPSLRVVWVWTPTPSYRSGAPEVPYATTG